MTDSPNQMPELSAPSISRRRWRISLVWLVPAIAAVIGLSMLVHALLSEGPRIEVTFRTAAGLEAGKTAVKYKDVTVGTVSAIALSDDGSHVVATISLVKSALSLTRKDTRFWVVRPRIGTGGISGVDTLLSGAYVAVDAGTAAESSYSFTGLETPPTVVRGTAGRSFTLHSDDLGSVDIGSPVYYRRIQVGRVASYQLEADGTSVNLQVFVEAPYDRLVTTDSRFWNASGVDVSLGADGLKLKTQSLATIIAGGIAFAAPPGSLGGAAAEHAEYRLARDQASAMESPDGPAQYIQLRFAQSLRGLSVGAPVYFLGVDLGRVVSIDLDYDRAKQRFPTVVGIVVFPKRLGRVLEKLPKLEGAQLQQQQQSAQFLQMMVEHGLRAQARSGNLLTGQLYVALDFMPNAQKVEFDVSAQPLTLPTVNGSFDQLQEQLASIVSKIDKMPLESIARNVDATVADLDSTLKQVNGQVLPEATLTVKQARQTFSAANSVLAQDAPLQQNLSQTLLELQSAARSLRTLTDLLSRNPESLLRGRTADPSPGKLPAIQPALSKEQPR